MAKRTSEKPTLTLKTAASNLRSAILNTPMQTLASRLMYVVLLIAFLVIGYLIGKVETLQKGAISAAIPSQIGQTAPQQPQAPTAPKPEDVKKKLTIGTFPVKGNKDAKVTIIEFADFRCPFCEKFFSDSEPQILKDYVDTGKVKFAFRNYAFLGPASTVAANAAACANDQGKFWDFYDYLYKNQPPESDTTMYTTEKLSAAAGTLGMDTAQFSSCMDSKKFDKNVSQDFSDGQAVGVSGTPTFYINGVQLVGAQPYASIKAVIDQELAKN